MKTQLFLLAFCFYMGVSYAQPTFEHTFNDDVSLTYPFNTHNETMYYNANTTTNKINIYKGDFSLYKTISVTPPSGFNFVDSGLFSSKLFNTDNLLEFIAVFQNSSNLNEYKMILYNENLSVIADLGNRSVAMAFKTMDNQTKMNAYLYYYNNISQKWVATNDIYKLPGTIPNPNPSDVNTISINQDSNFPYPNPASSIINLPFDIRENEISTMSIFNTSGKLVETIQIQGTSNILKLSLDKYTSGIYVYEYKGISNTFIVR